MVKKKMALQIVLPIEIRPTVNNDGYVNNTDVFYMDWYNKGYMTYFTN